VNDRLYRSRDERMFAGVAGGVAERLDLDPSLVRVVWLILIFLTGGLFLLLYIVMAIVVPEAPLGADRWAGWPAPAAPGPGAVPGWSSPGAAGAAFATGEPTAGGNVPDTGAALDAAAPEAPAGGTPDVAPPGAPPPDAPPSGTPTPPPTATQAPPPAWNPAPTYRHEHRRGGGAIIGGLILILLGGYFLIRTLFPDIAFGAFWPVILIVIGVALVIGSFRPGRGG
jgi:phage shock protein PspC (stress-responsive transcriptional regulator)